jgi:predicted DNA-binding protein (MmcQ/YjbR family)
MVTVKEVAIWALAFDETEEQPHFDKRSFRVKKKIFVTLDTKAGYAHLKLTSTDQSLFSQHPSRAIYPIPNAWGKQGWTRVELKKVRKDLFKAALTNAYCAVAPKRLVKKIQLEN